MNKNEINLKEKTVWTNSHTILQRTKNYVDSLDSKEIELKSHKKLIKVSQKRYSTKKLSEYIKEIKDSTPDIPNFHEFWKNYFPNIFDSNLSLNNENIFGISNLKSKLDNSSSFLEITINFNIFSFIIHNLINSHDKFDSDEITISISNDSICTISQDHSDFGIIFNFPQEKAPNQNKIIDYDSKSIFNEKIWKKFFTPLSQSRLINRNFDFQDILIIDKQDEYFKQKMNNIYEKVFSLSHLKTILDKLRAYKVSFKGKAIKSLQIDFFEANLRLIPIYDNLKTEFGIFISRKANF